MRLKKERISALAETLVDRLTGQQIIRTEASKGDIAAGVEQIITDELSVEDRLDDDVRKLLDQYQAQINKGQADERTLFLMIKKQLAKEKGVIL